MSDSRLTEIKKKSVLWNGSYLQFEPTVLSNDEFQDLLNLAADGEEKNSQAQALEDAQERIWDLRDSLTRMKRWADYFWVHAEKILKPKTDIEIFLKDTETARQLLQLKKRY